MLMSKSASTLVHLLLIVCLLSTAMPLMGQVPYQVKVINPTYSASIRDAVGMNGIGYFVAGSNVNFSNGQWDEELWRTDGTDAGTYRVKDIRQGDLGSNIKWMTVVGNTLYFSANDGMTGDELWKSDGTAAGTVRVVELSVGSGSGYLQSLVEYDGALYFIGTYANGSTYLFRSDGTAAGTVPVSTAVSPNAPTSVDPNRRLTVWNGYLWFTGIELPTYGSSGLYRSDGTSAGTIRITTLNSPGADMVAATNQLFFTANDAYYRRELWRSDGTAAGTYMTKDLNPINTGYNGDSGAWIYWTVGDVCLFSAVDGNPYGNRKLYRSDGTEGGTYLLIDIYPGGSDVTNGPRTNADRTYMVWESLQQGVSSSGRHLYVTDGSSEGTTRLKSFLGFCQNFMAMDGVVYFRADDGSAAGGTELWRTDGTIAGTSRYADINPGPGGSNPYPVGFFGNLGLLHAGPSYPQLWAFRLCNSAAPSATITPSGPTMFCQGENVTLTAPSGMSSYLWSNGETTQSIIVSTSGDYTVTVNDSSGCSATSALTTVTVNSVPLFGIHANQAYNSRSIGTQSHNPSSSTYCGTDVSVALTSTVLDPSWTYSWSTGATRASIIVNTSGTYTLTATAPNGCSHSESVTIDIRTPPTVDINGSRNLCPGGTTTLTASAGASYLWSTGATTQSIAVDAPGSYSVTVTADNGCTGGATADVVMNEASLTADGPTSFCYGGSVTLTAGPGSTYVWSTGATTQSILVAESGTYSVTQTFADGCSLTPEPIVVTEGPAAVYIAVDDDSVCPGTTMQFTSNITGGSDLTYQWLFEEEPISGATSPTLTHTPDHVYYGRIRLAVTDAATGCSITSNPLTYFVFPPPEPVVQASGPTTFCEGGGVILTAEDGWASYEWSTGATGQSIFVTQPGSYTVTVTNGGGCPGPSDPVVVTVNSNPDKPAVTTSGPLTFCEGGSVTLTAPAGYTYNWSTGATTQSITLNTSASVSVTVTNANGCSATSDPVTVTVNALPPPTVTADGPTTFCQGGSVTLTAPAGLTYSWSTGATTPSITVSDSGNYSVTVTNANGCSATSAPTSVTVNDNPLATITASGPTTFCQGGSVTLTAPAGYTYAWSTGATTQSIIVSQSGSYSVTITNAGGCSASSAATSVTVNPLPDVPVISGPTSFCPNTSITLSAPSGYASYLWSNGAATQSVTVSAAANYTVTVTNAQGCSRTSPLHSVTANPSTQITVQPANISISRNTTGQLSVTATGTEILQYRWYYGYSGDTSKPVIHPTATSRTLTVGPYHKKGTYRFWVRITSSTCTATTVNSNTANVTVIN